MVGRLLLRRKGEFNAPPRKSTRNCAFPSTASAVGAKNQNVRPLRSAWPGSVCEKVDVTRVQLGKG